MDRETTRRRILVYGATIPLVPSLITSKSALAQDWECDTPNCIGEQSPFVPVNPMLARKTFVWNGLEEKEIPWSSLTEAERRNQLSNQDAKVVIEKIDNGVSVGYFDSGASLKKGSYRVVVDYLRYKDEIVREAGAIVGRGKVGVGVRVTANVVTRSSGLNLAGLIPIAVGFKRNKLVGDLEVRVVGIVSPQVAKIISPPTSLNEDSITKAMEAFGAFRVVIDQGDTQTVPHLLAVSRSGGSYAIDNSLKALGSKIS